MIVILDRDGVINKDSPDYIRTPEDWHASSGSLAAIARLNRVGCNVKVATNQSAVQRGYLSIAALTQIPDSMHNALAEVGGDHIDAIVYCPHGPGDGCACRKPATCMLVDLEQRLGCSASGMPYVGDSLVDMQTSRTVTG